MLNFIWLGLVISAVLIGGFHGKLQAVVEGTVKGAETAVTLSIGLIGIMALWLGLMRIAEKAGLIQTLAFGMRPLLRWLFPDVPVNHPAMGSMVMNIAANMLGLTNAATPLGLRAMKDLSSLNPNPGTASNAMCTFLAINTSSVQLLPITAIAILAAGGSKNPSAIIGTAFLATICSTVAGVSAVKFLEKFSPLPKPGIGAPDAANSTANEEPEVQETKSLSPLSTFGKIALIALSLSFAWFFLALFRQSNPEAGSFWLSRSVNALSILAIPGMISFFALYASLKGIKIYDEIVQGAKEGFEVAVRIIPFLVAMLVAIGMFRAAGGIDLLTRALRPLLDLIAFPPELLPMALMRPLSGSGSLAIFSELVKEYGPDHLLVRMAGTIYGSTETTFYVIAVYFGSVAVTRTRHAIPAGLIADGVGIAASIIICRIAFS